jgi:hypothetical protein
MGTWLDLPASYDINTWAWLDKLAALTEVKPEPGGWPRSPATARGV